MGGWVPCLHGGHRGRRFDKGEVAIAIVVKWQNNHHIKTQLTGLLNFRRLSRLGKDAEQRACELIETDNNTIFNSTPQKVSWSRPWARLGYVDRGPEHGLEGKTMV